MSTVFFKILLDSNSNGYFWDYDELQWSHPLQLHSYVHDYINKNPNNYLGSKMSEINEQTRKIFSPKLYKFHINME